MEICSATSDIPPPQTQDRPKWVLVVTSPPPLLKLFNHIEHQCIELSCWWAFQRTITGSDMIIFHGNLYHIWQPPSPRPKTDPNGSWEWRHLPPSEHFNHPERQCIELSCWWAFQRTITGRDMIIFHGNLYHIWHPPPPDPGPIQMSPDSDITSPLSDHFKTPWTVD